MNFEELIVRWNGGTFRGAQTRFAKAARVTQATVSRWISGGYPPDRDARPRIAKLLGISEGQLDELFKSKKSLPAGVDVQTLVKASSFVPVLGPVAADRFSVCFDAVADEYIPNPYPGKKVFALRVSGDCMEPTFRDGEYIYLSEAQPVADGKIVLAQLNGEYTLKRYYRRADGIELVPDNKRYRSIKITTNTLVIKGVVVGTYRKDI